MTLSADGVKRDEEAAVDTMEVEVLARSDEGVATRVRIACDRRAPLSSLASLLRSILLPPPSSSSRTIDNGVYLFLKKSSVF